MIRAERLVFSYNGSQPYILNGIDLEIKDGEYVSVVGENGCGKSTLIHLILKLLKPTGGTVTSAAKVTGYVPQKSGAVNTGFPITVYETLNSYRKLMKIKDKDSVFTRLEQVGMSGYKNALMGTLSGGQYQKILLARSLIGSPDLLILDEPSTGVDLNSQAEIYGILKRLNKDSGITIVSVEHNLDAAISNSTLLYHLTDGRGHLCAPRQYADEFLRNRG